MRQRRRHGFTNGGTDRDTSVAIININADPQNSVSTRLAQQQTCRRISVILSYCGIWTWFPILVHYSHNAVGGGDDKLEDLALLSSAIFIIIVEIIKSFANGLLYLREDPQKTPMDLYQTVFSVKMKWLMLKYMPIAVLYAIYNNLMFLNLRSNNPVTYQVISSSRIILTSVVWQMIFKGATILPARKVAIVVIFVGIVLKNMAPTGNDVVDATATEETTNSSYTSNAYLGNIILMLLQMSCSVLAGIYNEVLLKNDDFGSQFLQNISLTFTSMGLNVLVGMVEFVRLRRRGLEIDIWAVGIKRLMTPASIAIVFTLAILGIMSSTMLRYENSITKGVTSGIVTVLVTLTEYLCFSHVFVRQEMLGIFLVCSGTVLYFVAFSILPSEDNPVRLFSNKFCGKTRIMWIRLVLAALVLCAMSSFYTSLNVKDTISSHNLSSVSYVYITC